MPIKRPYNTRSKSLPIEENHLALVTPLPEMHHNHIHHHDTAETTHVWSSPLFSFTNIPRYVSTVICPCAVFSEIMNKFLTMPLVKNENTDLCRCTSCCSGVTYFFFPCVYQGATSYIQYTKTADEGSIFDYIYYNPPPIDNLETGSVAHIGLLVCLGSLCVIPATCIVRQIATQKYGTKEPMWTSGLVSCFAWPCGVVQVADELKYQNT